MKIDIEVSEGKTYQGKHVENARISFTQRKNFIVEKHLLSNLIPSQKKKHRRIFQMKHVTSILSLVFRKEKQIIQKIMQKTPK